MKKLDQLQKKNFQHIRNFPGDTGNPFDVILHGLNKVQEIPIVIYLIGLVFLSGVGTLFNPSKWIILSIFFLGDFFLLYILPKLKISFGPPQPQSLLLAILRIPFIFLPYPFNVLMQGIGTILVLIGFIFEPSHIKLTKKEIISKKNSKQKTRFIHLGDLHLEKIGLREAKLLRMLNHAKPDYIFFTGDFLNLSYRSELHAIQTVSDLFSKINDIAPTYWVTGSPAVDLDKTIQTISSLTTATWLNDTSLILNQNIELIGLNCSHQPHKDIQKFKEINRAETPLYSILLYHSPDLILELSSQEIDLMLSGHTHGGQVRIPFFGAIFTGSLYGRKLQAGVYQFYNTILYITRGLGLEGLGAPRVRFFCPPEIIEWTIHH